MEYNSYYHVYYTDLFKWGPTNMVLSRHSVNYMIYEHIKQILLCNNGDFGLFHLSQCRKYIKHLDVKDTIIYYLLKVQLLYK